MTSSNGGREAHTLINFNIVDFPHLVHTMSFDAPGKNLRENAMFAIETLLERGFKPGHFVTDRAYLPGLKPEEFQLPLQAMGFKLVMDYDKNELGQLRTGGYLGFILVEGQFYSPSMPEELINASIDYLNREKDDPKRIDYDTYMERIERRKKYQVKLKQSKDREGFMRVMCPALGKHASIRCPRREPHPDSLDRAMPRGFPDKMPPSMFPLACTQGSVTIPPEVGGKYRQEYPYQTKEWAEHYRPARSRVENLNKMMKMGHTTALHDPARRPARGYFAQLLYTAVLIAATNARIIYIWLKKKASDTKKTVKVTRKRQRKLSRGWMSGLEGREAPPDEEMPQAA